MEQKRKRYDKEFKEFIIQELQTGSKVMDISRKYGIPNQTVSEWRRDAEVITTRRKTRYTEKEVYRLEQENKILKEELKVLKKAMRFVSISVSRIAVVS